jgi:LDH2 family malate/lactate/ureidoglycolate dehydrogenase
MVLVSLTQARSVAQRALERAGLPADNARLQADLLIEAELRGTPSHGLLRLERLVHRVANGVADPVTRGRHEWIGSGLLKVDGQNGMGPVVAMAALEAIAERARSTGIAAAAIANSNHIGMLAYYVEKIAAQGQVAIALTTSEALVHPWGGRIAMIGTNPIAIGVPTAQEPFVVDLATSLVSMGEIHDHAHRGAPLPEGWALDAEGNATTNAEAAKHGAIAPFGGAKGYALGLAFELLVTAVTGAALGRDVVGTLDADKVCNKGDLFIVIEAGTAQAAALSRFIAELRALPPAEGFAALRIPNEASRRLRAERIGTGLPVADEVWTAVSRLGAEDH